MIFFLLLIITIFSFMGFVNGINILKLINFYNEIDSVNFWLIYVITIFIIFLLILIKTKKTQKSIGAILGFIIYYFLINICFMIIPVKSSESIEIIKLLLTTIITIIGIINVHRIKITNYNIKVKKDISNLNIVMFADLHLGILINHEELSKIVKEINKLKPDLILIPGDFFNGSMKDSNELHKISMELKKLKSKDGIFLSPGNHDLFIQNEELREFLKNNNITLLDDRIVNINNISIIGRKDYRPIDTFRTDYKRKSIKDLIKQIDNNNLLILLDHQPSDLLTATNNNIDITLSGHTHKGQFFPGSIITNLININHYGYKKLKETHMIVTSGIGYWQIPLRVGTASEIVNIKINYKS